MEMMQIVFCISCKKNSVESTRCQGGCGKLFCDDCTEENIELNLKECLWDISDYDNSNFKNTVSASYVLGYAIYPYEIWKFRFWGGVQIGKCLNGKMNKTENGIEQEITMDSNDYNLDFGLLAGTDFMITKNIGSRFSYYYGITKILKEDVTLNINETNLNIMNVGVNTQLLLRF